MDEDYQLALLLQKELNDDLPEIKLDQPKKGKESKSTHSLIDPQWEFIDPTPDIHVLFLQFNDRFFWGKLHGVEVKWSPRMTSCAGVCVYQGKSGFCSVRLSLPLLKLRPRKDLVETLLHEMIHAFLFVTKNNRDRDGHGPEFHRHMDRINGEAGTHISVYHTFHDEVRLYQQHWWRCDGPCQHRPPFFGMVRRSMNRAPGPYDNWWAQHQATCGGKFVKVKEPDDTKKKASNTKQKTSGDTKGKIYSFFPVSANSGSSVKKVANISDSNADNSKSFTNPSSSGSSTKNSEDYQLDSNRIGASSIFRKPAMSNVHGLGSDKHSASLVKPTVNPAINNVFGFGDLSGQKNTKPNGSHPPSGKGNVLGGSRKPPFAVGKGGVLANKGSGTLVVSGTKSKNQGLPGSSTIWNHNTKTQVFSGTGHVLGKGTSRPSAASSSVQVKSPEKLNPFPLIVPMCTNKDEDISRKRKSFENVSNEEVTSSAGLSRVICPVCSEQVLGSVINSHLDHCIVSFKKPTETKIPKLHTSSDDVIVLSDSEDTIPSAGDKVPEFEADVYCPSCNNKLKKSNLDSHLSLCVGNSFEDDDSIEIVSENPGKNVKCPICGNDVCTGEMDKHLENCASCSIQDLSGVFDEDFSDEEEDAAVGSPSKRISESGEPLFPCPCCLVLIESIKMHDHLDQCVA